MKQQSNKKRPENASARIQNFKIFWGSMPLDPPSVEGPLGLRQIYPPVALKYLKLIETPDFGVSEFNKTEKRFMAI